LLLSGIPSAETFGTAKFNLRLLLSGIASAAAFGSPVVNLVTRILPSGIASAEALGTPSLRYTQQVTGAGNITSAEAFGLPVVIVFAGEEFEVSVRGLIFLTGPRTFTITPAARHLKFPTRRSRLLVLPEVRGQKLTSGDRILTAAD
jgi:hypothetical protein